MCMIILTFLQKSIDKSYRLCYNIFILSESEVIDMLKLLIKALDRYQRKQALKRRIKHNHQQYELILQGLDERGY